MSHLKPVNLCLRTKLAKPVIYAEGATPAQNIKARKNASVEIGGLMESE
jgi:hypothetical protein